MVFQVTKAGKLCAGHHHAVNHTTTFAVPDGQKAGICPEHLALPAAGAAQPGHHHTGREGTVPACPKLPPRLRTKSITDEMHWNTAACL